MNVTVQKELRQLGVEHGREWRTSLATKGQLVRLGRLLHDIDFEDWFYKAVQHSNYPAEILACVIDPTIEQHDYPFQLLAEFGEQVNGGEGDLDDPDYLAGFCEGATEVPAKRKVKK